MSDGLSGISAESLLQVAEQLKDSGAEKRIEEGAPEFQEMLNKLISEVDEAQKEADQSIQSLASGDPTSIQDVVMKMEEADLAFKLMKEVRDKLITAYKETITMS